MTFRFMILLLALALAAPSVFSADRKKPSVSPRPAADSELDHAFAEFKSAAERLGRTMARAADENTAEARQKLMKTMSGALTELSHSMDQASRRLESKPSAEAAPSPSPR